MIDFILRPFRRNFGKDKIFFRIIDDMFGFIPHNIELYKLALIHKSASITLDNGQHINNERLEFLGDAVIETITSDYLFIEFPDKSEGFLTQMRSKIVSRQSLNAVAKRIGLDDHVITNATNHSSQKHIYGDAFEAMMGAIYLDQGYDFVNRLLINKIFVEHLKPSTLVEAETDFKSRLIEWCQKNHHSIHFDTAHDKTYSSSHPFFYSKVLIDNIEVGYGAGESKKEAEQRAAFSVSQGFNDEDCNKLLDKLDNIESSKANVQKPRKEKIEKVEKTEKAEKTEIETAKPDQTPTEEATKVKKPRPKKTKEEETKQESDKNETVATDITIEEKTPEVKPKRNTRARRTAKSKAENADTPAQEQSAENNDNTSVAQEAAEEKADKPKPRPRRRRTSKSAGSDAIKTETETTSKEE